MVLVNTAFVGAVIWLWFGLFHDISFLNPMFRGLLVLFTVVFTCLSPIAALIIVRIFQKEKVVFNANIVLVGNAEREKALLRPAAPKGLPDGLLHPVMVTTEHHSEVLLRPIE